MLTVEVVDPVEVMLAEEIVTYSRGAARVVVASPRASMRRRAGPYAFRSRPGSS